MGYGERPVAEGAGVRYYEASVTIQAPPDRVWAVLSDVTRWPGWDSGVDAVDGAQNGVQTGTKLTIRAAVAAGRAVPVRVTTYVPPNRMVFTGWMPLGLFRGVRSYAQTPAADGTEFRLREEYTGVLLGLIWRSIPDLGPSFQQFAVGLKACSE